MNKFLLFSTFLLVFFKEQAHAQTFKSAGEYMSYIGQQHSTIARDVFSYSSAVAHGKSARKVEGKRQAMLGSIREATKKISAMPPFQEDRSLRDSTVAYLKTAFIVVNNEYDKIINMEEVAEQSYDAMEAYLLAQDLADEHMDKAESRVNSTTKEFAAKHKVNLVDGSNDEIHKKLQVASKVNSYHRMVYLVFFKSNKQELYLVNAIEKKNLNEIEQNKTMLSQYLLEGLKKLDTMKSYNNDRSLINATKQTLEFYKNECETKVPVISNFLLKEDNFTKIKKAMDVKRESERTKEDVDSYNAAINEFNGLVQTYNTTTQTLNQERTKVVGNWNKTSNAFLDKYVP